MGPKLSSTPEGTTTPSTDCSSGMGIEEVACIALALALALLTGRNPSCFQTKGIHGGIGQNIVYHSPQNLDVIVDTIAGPWLN